MKEGPLLFIIIIDNYLEN